MKPTILINFALVKQLYLDNAATTPMLPEVIALITESMTTIYGNPSSVHQIGRKAKAMVETARKNIAKQFNATASEIVFTAGGSEADNLILRNAVTNLGVKTIISSKIEHHAVLHTIKQLEKEFEVTVKWVDLNEYGSVDLDHLEALLKSSEDKKIVSLMYVNNEIGNILNIEKVGKLCLQNSALFHTDAVQAVGHIQFNATFIDFFAASAHKFHGPKGVGFAFIKKGFGIQPLLFGGEQERGARAGTENVHAIVGMEKALQLSIDQLNTDGTSIKNLKSYLIENLKTNFPTIQFNGLTSEDKASSHILNVRFDTEYPMLLFNLDLKGIAVSGGSACQSGSSKGSHVLNTILNENDAKNTSLRISFSKLNTLEELDYFIEILKMYVK